MTRFYKITRHLMTNSKDVRKVKKKKKREKRKLLLYQTGKTEYMSLICSVIASRNNVRNTSKQGLCVLE